MLTIDREGVPEGVRQAQHRRCLTFHLPTLAFEKMRQPRLCRRVLVQAVQGSILWGHPKAPQVLYVGREVFRRALIGVPNGNSLNVQMLRDTGIRPRLSTVSTHLLTDSVLASQEAS